MLSPGQRRIEDYKTKFTGEHYNLKQISTEFSRLTYSRDFASATVLLAVVCDDIIEDLISTKCSISQCYIIVASLSDMYGSDKVSRDTKEQIIGLAHNMLNNTAHTDINSILVVDLYENLVSNGVPFDLSLFDNLIEHSCKYCSNFETFYNSPEKVINGIKSKFGFVTDEAKLKAKYLQAHLLNSLEFLLQTGRLTLTERDSWNLERLLGDNYVKYAEVIEKYMKPDSCRLSRADSDDALRTALLFN